MSSLHKRYNLCSFSKRPKVPKSIGPILNYNVDTNEDQLYGPNDLN